LRKNGGGLLDQAIDLTGLFVHHGPVVQVRNSNGQINTLRTEDVKQLYSGPLIVLVGHLSASASEIVAGALQDYNRAVIVGDSSTHGKGTVQTLLPLERWVGFGFHGDPGKLKLTVQKFYRIAGGSTQQKGVIPDIQLPSLLDYLELGERTLPNCLPYDTVDKVDYENFSQATPYFNELKQRSVVRIAQSHDFTYLKQDIEVLKKRLADKSVSLNEDQRKKEKADLVTQAKSRKAEREARTTPPDKAYELTLDDVDKNKPLDQLTLVSVAEAEAQADKDKAKDKDKDKEADSILDEDPTVDPHLDETVNILVDYAALLTDKNALANKAP
jgi:carboxyl-terminal processing protease